MPNYSALPFIRRFLTALAVSTPVWLAVGGIVLAEGSLHVRRSSVADSGLAGSSPVQIVAADGVVLRGSFFRTAQDGNCVIVLHGIGDSRFGAAGFQPGLGKAGFAVLTPDARGHGTSGGALVTYGVLEQDDASRWAMWLRGTAGCRKVYGLGESLGAASLIMAAALSPGAFDAIVAECSYSDLPQIAVHRVGLLLGGPQWLESVVGWPLVWSATAYTRMRYGLDLRSAAPSVAARSLRTPLLLIHGLDDRLTPPEHSRQIRNAAPHGIARLWEVPEAGHTAASRVAGPRFWAEVLGHFGAGAGL